MRENVDENFVLYPLLVLAWPALLFASSLLPDPFFLFFIFIFFYPLVALIGAAIWRYRRNTRYVEIRDGTIESYSRRMQGFVNVTTVGVVFEPRFVLNPRPLTIPYSAILKLQTGTQLTVIKSYGIERSRHESGHLAQLEISPVEPAKLSRFLTFKFPTKRYGGDESEFRSFCSQVATLLGQPADSTRVY